LSESLRVTWQVTPLQPPLVRRHCRRCAGEKPFVCSMRFRTNAQKKRLDVWLIYRCSACEEVWNLPIVERAAIGEIDGFDAITHNDPALALRYAFDRVRLMRHGAIDERTEVSICKSHDAGCAREACAIAIGLAVVQPSGLRLERLLTSGLGISRAQLFRLHDAGALCLSPAPRKGLRTPIMNGHAITIELTSLDAALAQALRRAVLA
jgi:hypothetical protein